MGSAARKNQGPNALAVGVLLVLLGLGGVASAVDGVATLVVFAAALVLLDIIWLLTIGWSRPGAALGPAPSTAPLPRGRVLRTPPRRDTPTV
jgi:hypothetical protein